MFREMARKKQQLPYEECIRLLKEEPRGVLSLLGDDGYPYGIPMNHWYSEADGRLYFHSGKHGHKVDALMRCSKASFCVYDQGYREEGDWALNIKSVVVFGRIEILEDHDAAMEMVWQLSLKYTTDLSYIEQEILQSGPNTLCFALVPEHMTGKLTKEA